MGNARTKCDTSKRLSRTLVTLISNLNDDWVGGNTLQLPLNVLDFDCFEYLNTIVASVAVVCQYDHLVTPSATVMRLVELNCMSPLIALLNSRFPLAMRATAAHSLTPLAGSENAVSAIVEADGVRSLLLLCREFLRDAPPSMDMSDAELAMQVYLTKFLFIML